MIQPNHLRIGNWVFDDLGNFAKVYSVHKSGGIKTEYDTGWAVTIRPHPIPLTPEIAESIPGFKKDSDDNGVFVTTDWPILCFNDDGSIELSLNLEYTVATIQYVHELQNFMFAINGKELEIPLI